MSKGFAIRRRGDCEAEEEDCGMTDKPYRACCPKNSFCPQQYNIDCCPSEKNCTSEIVQEPRCADERWDLYDNGGYFCCAPGLLGYNSTRNTNGCASPGYEFEGGEESLPKVKAGKNPEPNDDSSEGGGSTNVGGIAGGVVGGVAALSLGILAIWWFFLRKRKDKGGAETLASGSPATAKVVPGSPRELDPLSGATGKPSELEGDEQGMRRSELADVGRTAGKPVQLAEQHGISELPG